MDKNDRLSLIEEAKHCLADAACSPTRLMFFHAGAILLFSVILTLLDQLLEQQIGTTGGLGGIGSRSVIVTAQAVLRLAQTVLLPFWQMGYVYTTMKLARKEAACPGDLLHGFSRIGPVFRLTLLKALIAIGIGILSVNIAVTIFFMTPFAAAITEAMSQISDPAIMNDPEALQSALGAAGEAAAVPLAVIMVITFLAVGAPVAYRYRMASYFLLDSEKPGAFAAMRSSRKLMRYLCMDLFRLDLSFWWFYLLELLAGALCYGDLILSWMGIALPFDSARAYFLFYGLYLAGQFALYLWRKNQVEVTYACTYEFLRSLHDPKQPPKPVKQPWVY